MSKNQKIILGLLILYPFLFYFALVSYGHLYWPVDDNMDSVERAYHIFSSAFIKTTLFGGLSILSVCLMWSQFKSLKIIFLFSFLTAIQFIALPIVLFETLFSFDVLVQVPSILSETPSPNNQLKAILYKVYQPPQDNSDRSSNSYLVSVEGEKFKRQILYVASRNCSQPYKIIWKNNNTLIVDSHEIPLGGKRISYISVGGTPEEPICEKAPDTSP